MATIVKGWILIILAVTALWVGISIGEDFITPPLSPLLGWCCLIGFFPLGWLLGSPGKAARWIFALALPLLLVLSWLGAAMDLKRATLDCEGQLDSLRADLVQFNRQKGRFPVSLEELGLRRLPGNRLIGQNILHYDFGVKRYRMYISPQARKEPWISCSVPRKK